MSSVSKYRALQLLAASAVTLVSTSVFAQSISQAEVTPYRPGAGFPAVLSATGRIELEVGFDRASSSGATAQSLGTLVKYGLTDNVGLLFGVPFLRVSAGGVSESGLGDALIGAKYVQKIQNNLAAGVQLTSTLPTGKRGVFRGDSPTVTLTGLVGVDFSGLHSDINLGVSRLGTANAGGSRNQINYSIGISKALDGGWGVAAELSGFRASNAPSTTTLLGAVTYSVNKTLAVDASLARSKSEGVGVNSVGVGMSYLLPQ